jgi:predicted negative regulator of RcsB-dependent stress response
MEAHLTVRLGDTYQAMGDDAAARERWQRAYEILTDAGHPQAADVGRKLDATAS